MMTETGWRVVDQSSSPVLAPNIIIETDNGIKMSTPVTYEELEDIRRRKETGENVEDDINRVSAMMTDSVIQLVKERDIDKSKDQVNKWILETIGMV